MKQFVDVILPLPLSERFTYELLPQQQAKIEKGCRVIVPFGAKKIYTAIVVDIHSEEPQNYKVKPVMELLDAHPILLPVQYRFWEWISDYYLCAIGDVYKAALPSGLKLESETLVVYNEDFEAQAPLTEREQLLLHFLEQKTSQTINQLEQGCEIKNILPLVKKLLDKGALLLKEEVKRNYKPKTETCVSLVSGYRAHAPLHALFGELKKAPKQFSLLMKYLEMALGVDALVTNEALSFRYVTKKELLQASGMSASVFSGLVQRGVFEIYHRETARIDSLDAESPVEASPLSETQNKAYQEVLSVYRQQDVCLLHGVTSSGKTEIYIHLILQMLKQGKQVLYLLPEIVLTTQLTERLKKVFGNRLGIYHSKFPDAERVEIWQKQLTETPYDIIIGVRSSVFLPFKNLGLVIVDEEHETTYKQQDPAPRYHARNAALVLASFAGAKTLLGTATPSLESYYNATTGKYGLVTLSARFKNVQLPEIEVVDIKELHRKHRMSGPFSPLLVGEIRQALDQQEQVILFQNRRGFAPMVECRVCGWVPKCKNCDVSLTYHKGLSQLTCHYCGYTYQLPRACPACGGTEMAHRGFGTEKIEDDIKLLFPEARVARMDLDTTRTRLAYEQIIANFQAGRTDILIGTQMVTKGLDFEHVSVVGILNADTMLNYPDFRSYERAFQMMAQVAGRAGRRNRRGRVILQTKNPDLAVVNQLVVNDFASLYQEQIEERNLFHYPPFCRLVYVYLKHKDASVLETIASQMAFRMRQVLGHRILGPDIPPVARVQMLYIRKIMVKVENTASMAKVRQVLKQIRQKMLCDERYRQAQIYYDVDPM